MSSFSMYFNPVVSDGLKWGPIRNDVIRMKNDVVDEVGGSLE